MSLSEGGRSPHEPTQPWQVPCSSGVDVVPCGDGGLVELEPVPISKDTAGCVDRVNDDELRQVATGGFYGAVDEITLIWCRAELQASAPSPCLRRRHPGLLTIVYGHCTAMPTRWQRAADTRLRRATT